MNIFKYPLTQSAIHLFPQSCTWFCCTWFCRNTTSEKSVVHSSVASPEPEDRQVLSILADILGVVLFPGPAEHDQI